MPTAPRSTLSRRQLLTAGAAAFATVAARGRLAHAGKAKAPPPGPSPSSLAGTLEQMKLPYPESALAPGISANVVSFHYGKHHKTYVDKTNDLVKGTPNAGKTLDELIRATAGKPDQQGLFNAVAQVWNHDLYWRSMKPKGGGTPSGELGKKIAADFGSFDAMVKELSTAATGQFGSGWAWLALDPADGKLKVMKTGNADNPLAAGKRALLTIDVWEHAYYLDYQNRRADYVKAFFDSLANWDFAAENLARKA